jgi:hypothetical protein
MNTVLRVTALAAAGCLALSAAGCAALEQGAQDLLGDLEKPAVIKADAPFAGSSAEKFGDGPDAIVPPRATRVGRYSARDVAYAYRVTKRILVAAYLDRPTLLGGKPVAYASALDPDQRKDFLKRLDHKDPDENSRSWVTSFAKGEAELVGDVIKVKGAMSAKEGKDKDGNPELQIDFAYRFVYAVRKPGTDVITRVMTYDKARVSFWRESPGARLRHWLGDSEEAWTAGIQCIWDGYVHPLYPGMEDKGALAQGPTEDPFADSTPSGRPTKSADEKTCTNTEEI